VVDGLRRIPRAFDFNFIYKIGVYTLRVVRAGLNRIESSEDRSMHT